MRQPKGQAQPLIPRGRWVWGSHTEKNAAMAAQKGTHTQSLTQSSMGHTHMPRHNEDRQLAYAGQDTRPGAARCHGPAPGLPSSGHAQAQTPFLLQGSPSRAVCTQTFPPSSGVIWTQTQFSLCTLRLPRSGSGGQGLESPQRATPGLRGSQTPQSSPRT